MQDAFIEKIIKSIKYGSTPFRYPRHFFYQWKLIFSNRPLIGELVHLSEHKKWYETIGFNTIIDVGAYIGSYALAMKTILPQATIYSFEPIQKNYEHLIKNLDGYKKFKAFNTALGDSNGNIEFWKNEFAASSSILDIEEEHIKAFPATKMRDQIQVPISCLDEYKDEMEIIHPVLLKMDVQGYEDKVINGAKQILNDVDYIITEVSFRSLYKDQPLFGDIYDHLSSLGFQYGGNFETLLSPKDGSILQADALFYRA